MKINWNLFPLFSDTLVVRGNVLPPKLCMTFETVPNWLQVYCVVCTVSARVNLFQCDDWCYQCRRKSLRLSRALAHRHGQTLRSSIATVHKMQEIIFVFNSINESIHRVTHFK